MTVVFQEVRNALGSNHFIILFGISLILLLAFAKGKRKLFVVPGIVAAAVILNPWFHAWWNSINDYGYWRTLWIVPVLPFCAAVPALLSEKGKKQWIAGVAAAAFAILVIALGAFIYRQPNTRFEKADNAEKLPSGMVEVANALLDLDDTPYVVTDSDICIYLRQYSGKIHLMYARDIFWGAGSEIEKTVFRELTAENGDLDSVVQIMLNYDYRFLVAKNVDETRKKALEKAGFVFERQVGQYSIFYVTGKRTELRTYNELHQVTSLTFLNEEEKPVDNASGVATILYEYDKGGWLSRELRTNTEGKPVADTSGKAGYWREYDRRGLLLREGWIGADGAAVEINGYASYSHEYNRRKLLTEERYYNIKGELTLREDTLVAKKKVFYDKEDNVTGERFYDTDGNLTIASYGYAGCDREYDEKNRMIRESYVDTDGKPVAVKGGYCAFVREYDDADNVTAEYYLDEKGERTACTAGYACVRKDYNENRKVIREWYEDPEENGVLLAGGYAGIIREYDDSDNVITEIFLDAEGKESPRDTGVSRICREYDAEDRMIRESYFNGGAPCTAQNGYSVYIRFYDEKGNVREERYFGENGEPIVTGGGYAAVRHNYDDNNRKIEDLFLDTAGNPAVIEPGYAKCQYTYTENGQLALVTYKDGNNQIVEAGSAYLHEYLQSLQGRNLSLFFAAKDEASAAFTVTLQKDLEELGINKELKGQYRKSFYAAVTPQGVQSEVSEEMISCEGTVEGLAYLISSAGFEVGNSCSIVIDGVEYAKNVRGLNIVVFDNEKKEVVDTIAFDTFSQDMRVTK